MLTLTKQTKSRSLHIRDYGLADYRQILQQQHELRNKRLNDQIPDTVLIAEHPPVITLGARQSANRLLTDRAELTKQGIDLVEIRRGGGATAHNPGQLVFYPILNLKDLGLGVSEYIRELEAIGIELLAKLGIKAHRRKGFPGLWVEDKQAPAANHEPPATRKIASIGVRVSKSITYHGMAINIQNDLTIFDHLVPCGLDGIEMTSVQKETCNRHSVTNAKEKLSQLLIKHFSSPSESRATSHQRRKLPTWLKRRAPLGQQYRKTEELLNSLGLNTICFNANCPNRGHCWSKGTAAVLILGNICTRNCTFCSVATGSPVPPDPAEPAKIAEMVKRLGLKYLVITSVTRDDLLDDGASHFRDCINEVRRQAPQTEFEILTPDFRSCPERAIETLKDALPFVFAHNLETIPSLYRLVRPGANYRLSLHLLQTAKAACPQTHTKSSIMLGLGETDTEINHVLEDLRSVGCDRITIGQYLKPSKNAIEVTEYLPPEKFDFWKQTALKLGFSWVHAAPFARTSYLAEQQDPS
jgi:lipoic acid synthetase